MSNPLTDVIPAKARKYVYAVSAAVGLGLGAVPVYCAAIDESVPKQVQGALAVYAFVVGGLGFSTASSNVSTEPAPVEGEA